MREGKKNILKKFLRIERLGVVHTRNQAVAFSKWFLFDPPPDSPRFRTISDDLSP
jgi:hypothetical protein